MTFKDFRKVYGVHFTTKHTGKMQGMQSLSTSALCNKYCKARAKDITTICHACYAVNLMTRYKNTAKVLEGNTKALTTSIIPVEDMPIINAQIFRLESFGDLNNEIQFINYINLCRANKGVTVSIWTKNLGIIDRVLKDGYKKPSNMIIIYSNPFVDMPINQDKYKKAYPFIDKFFNVYTKEYATENNTPINCGARKCIECRKCYSKRTTDTINEIKK